MTKNEVMQRLIDALDKNDNYAQVIALAEIRTALAQPEQKPHGYLQLKNAKFYYELEGVIDHKNYLPLYTAPPQRKPLNEREIELIDDMIEVQLIHAERCDSMPNRAMAEKQKRWNMERVELLTKLKE